MASLNGRPLHFSRDRIIPYYGDLDAEEAFAAPRGELRDESGRYFHVVEWHPHLRPGEPITVTIEAAICREMGPNEF